MISQVGQQIYLSIITFWSWYTPREKLSHTVVTVVSVLTLVLVWKLLYSKKDKSTPLPPGPYGLPVVGYLPFLNSNLHQSFTNLAHKYGPIFSLRLGSKFHVVVNSIDLVKVVVREMDQTMANRSPPATAVVISYGRNNIAWSNNTTKWRNLRKILASEVLSTKNLNACQSFRTLEVRKAVNEVYTNIGKKIDISEVAFKTELNVVTSMLWGSSKSSQGEYSSYIGDGFREVQCKIIELLGAPNISDFLPLLTWFDIQGRQRDMQRQLEFVDRIFDSIIEDKLKAKSRKIEAQVDEDTRKDLLQVLLEIKEQKDAPIPISIIQIKALLIETLVAATDTTSTMVEWVMTEMLNNPVVMRKCQDELTQVVGMNNIVEESHLSKLTYLDAAIKETFRLHTPVPLLLHRCPDESCKIAGYTIPKGSILYMNAWAIHRDPKNWSDPLEFKPERFLNDTWDYKGNNLMFLPFGSGRRICPGLPLGEKMLVYIIASLLHSFEWSLPTDVEFDLSDVFGVVMKKRTPLIAIPSPRLSDASLYMA